MQSMDTCFHLGLMARLNDAVNTEEGVEMEYFHNLIEEGGGAALDAGCGAGRLLVRTLRAGLDVEGSDISPDMLELARQNAEAAGLHPVLHEGATGRLRLPRRYRTIVMCGSFGLNGARRDDFDALASAFRHLEPGGTLSFDASSAWTEPDKWARFASADRFTAQPWRTTGTTPLRDGTAIVTSMRMVYADPLEQQYGLDLCCDLVEDGVVVRSEIHRLVARWYAPWQLVAVLEAAGFVDVTVRSGYSGEPVRAEDEMQVYLARRP